MRRLLALVSVLAGALVLSMGISAAGASSKFAYSEEIQFPSGSLVVRFAEASQKRFTSVDYQLTATATATACTTLDGVTKCIGSLAFPSNTVTLVPDEKGQVTGSFMLAGSGSVGGGLCECTLHTEYSDVTLTNLTSGHVYRLDPIVGDFP